MYLAVWKCNAVYYQKERPAYVTMWTLVMALWRIDAEQQLYWENQINFGIHVQSAADATRTYITRYHRTAVNSVLTTV